jgi:hypothetical protein
MDNILLLLGVLVAIPYHETLHYIALRSLGGKVRGIVLSFLLIGIVPVPDEKVFNNNWKVLLIYLSPFLSGFLLVPFFANPFVLGFAISNIFGGLGDVYFFIKSMRTPKADRKRKALISNAKVFNRIKWKKYIKVRILEAQ